MGVEALFGWPSWLNRLISHPVAWIGWLISFLELRLNRGADRARLMGGALTVLVTLALTGAAAVAIDRLLPPNLWGDGVRVLLMASLLAARSLYQHVAAVAAPLTGGDLVRARRKLSMIVGRNPARLDEAAICRAAIESLAENSSDGVLAPLFWGLLAGLPGMAVYKAVNTLDSMIGYRNQRHEQFGKAAAKLDDAANWAPARLTALLLLLLRPGALADNLRRLRGDAPRHR